MTEHSVEKIRAALEPAASSFDCRLVDIEMTGRGKSAVLRLYIDKEGGVNVEDCAGVSRQAGLVLETEELIDGPFTLEVSSPGLTRPLKKPDDYRSAEGKLALVTLKKPYGENKSQKITCVIEKAEEPVLRVKEKTSGQQLEIPYSDIAKARLEIEF